MQVSLIEIWHNMGLPVRCVVVLLTLQAIACVGVAIDRFVLLARASSQSRTFAISVQAAMESGAYKTVVERAAAFPGNHLANYLEEGLRSFLKHHGAGDGAAHAAEYARRSLERKGDAISRDLNRGMNVLASTGSTAPFVGLLGTVLGIINAFKMIALTGSGGLGSIGSAISEALFVTAYGLIVAIPSVLIFNFLSSRIAAYEAGLLNAGSELVDQLELGGGPASDGSTGPSPLSRHPAQAGASAFSEAPRNPLPGQAR